MADKARVVSVIGEQKAPAEIRKALRKAGIPFVDVSSEFGYFNIRIYDGSGGYVRVYKNSRREVVVQEWTKCEFRYSGIPTFEPSGRPSF